MNYTALATALVHKASQSFRSFWTRPNNQKLLAAAALFFAGWALLSTTFFLTSFLLFGLKMAVLVYAAGRSLQCFLKGQDIITGLSLAFEDFQSVLKAQPDQRLSFLGDFLYDYLITGPVNTFNFFRELAQGKESASLTLSDNLFSNCVSGFAIGLFSYGALSLGIAGGIHFTLHAAWIGSLLTASSYLAQLSSNPGKLQQDMETFNNCPNWSQRLTLVQGFLIDRVDYALTLLIHSINWFQEVPETLTSDQQEALNAPLLDGLHSRLEGMIQTIRQYVVKKKSLEDVTAESSDDECDHHSDHSDDPGSALRNVSGNTTPVIPSLWNLNDHNLPQQKPKSPRNKG